MSLRAIALRRASLAAALLIACTSARTSTPAPAPEPVPEPAPAVDMDAMMARMVELATPGAEHEGLAAMAGSWDVTLESRWAPDMPWTSGTGRTESRMILGGRYLMEEHSFQVMGMDMQGLGMIGYDKLASEYTSLWSDSMSTWWISSRGKRAADGAIQYHGTMRDVAGERPFRMVVRPEADRIEAQLYDTIPGASPGTGELEVMRMHMRRAAPATAGTAAPGAGN